MTLSRDDQDTVDRLSDISGALRPNERFSPYLTFYPLPSGIYYVVARTWQDLQARRAGCVLTRSFLIRVEDWIVFGNTTALVDCLHPVERDGLNAQALVVEADTSMQMPIVPATQTLEIVEALFLEERQPIVVFGASDTDLVIERLSTALWPGLKRSFSACSFALAPRTISDRSFDLVFSPKESRSRFANWGGRRIDGTSDSDRVARHRWSLATAKRIFEDPHPSLARLDALGLLAQDQKGDESRLRLSLLWNDLLDQSHESPTAVLGMLDILHSQARDNDLGYDISDAIISAIAKLRDLPVAKRLEFLVPLCSKLDDFAVPIHLAISFQKTVREVAVANLSLAIDALSSLKLNACLATQLFFAGIGDGVIARAEDFLHDQLFRSLDDVLRLPPGLRQTVKRLFTVR